ncbi:DNA polymerase Y family protein [Planktomarina temperata]|nr:DNA polymerase Y family protein [Planktomarina temperata]
MSHRRVLSLWFPRMGAERLLRQARMTQELPFAVVQDRGQMQVISSLSQMAEERGLRLDQPLRDAMAMCPDLITRLRNPQSEARFLNSLRRWASKFSPWVAEEPPHSLVIDLTGCAHLFGGEEGVIEQVEQDCLDLGLSVHIGMADTKGAAWALARYAGQPLGVSRTGDAIDQEAPATWSRAVKRRNWERGGAAPQLRSNRGASGRIAQPGLTRQALAPLPVAALRLEGHVVTALSRLGLRRVEDLMGQPRAALARRFGKGTVYRMDQALGVAPEPISPAKQAPHFACCLSLPEPIGLAEDLLAALDKLLPRLAVRLNEKGQGARRLRLEAYRTDQTMQSLEVGLARPSADIARMRPLLASKLGDIKAEFGIDVLRLIAAQTEPIHAHQHKGHIEAGQAVAARVLENTKLDDLIGTLGARIGLEALTRLHPGDSHIPEKAAQVQAAAWSAPHLHWPAPPRARPLVHFSPEALQTHSEAALPLTFKWRGQLHEVHSAQGPERIAPEWWLAERAWRSGTRDYWQVVTKTGDRFWLYFAHGGAISGGWFCQGRFA